MPPRRAAKLLRACRRVGLAAVSPMPRSKWWQKVWLSPRPLSDRTQDASYTWMKSSGGSRKSLLSVSWPNFTSMLGPLRVSPALGTFTFRLSLQLWMT
jgi:hypothetical protein